MLERDLIGIHEPSERLLLLSSTSDYEETLSLSGHLLRNKEQICIHTRLCDAHVYILKKWIVDFLIQVRRKWCRLLGTSTNSKFKKILSQTDGFSTLKGELLPYIVKKQLSRANVLGEHDKLTSVINANTKVDEIFNVSCRMFRRTTHHKILLQLSLSVFYPIRTGGKSRQHDTVHGYAK